MNAMKNISMQLKLQQLLLMAFGFIQTRLYALKFSMKNLFLHRKKLPGFRTLY